jgi:hypothetical protein
MRDPHIKDQVIVERAGLQALFEHPRWGNAATRCLTCVDCTMVCPTCFCSTVEDVADLTGEHAERWRNWDSCFNVDFSHIASRSIRHSAFSVADAVELASAFSINSRPPRHLRVYSFYWLWPGEGTQSARRIFKSSRRSSLANQGLPFSTPDWDRTWIIWKSREPKRSRDFS